MSLYLALLFIFAVVFFTYMIQMPGRSWHGELPTLNESDRNFAGRLEAHVKTLCSHPGGRNYVEKRGLEAAKNYIAARFRSSGYGIGFMEYEFNHDTYANVEAELRGDTKPDEVIIVGAHYDAVIGAPGADDNGSGVAAVLELADLFRGITLPRTIRFVAFVNEESPFFMTRDMGSYAYAKKAAGEKENIIAMISLEMLGYYRDEPGSQHYLPPLNFLYPDRGNFIAFVGNLASRSLVTRAIQSFREHATFPSQGIAAPALLPGVSWSDHRSFWIHGFPAFMVTDTAFYRNPYYHTPEDTPNTLDYEKMVYVVRGIYEVIKQLARISHQAYRQRL